MDPSPSSMTSTVPRWNSTGSAPPTMRYWKRRRSSSLVTISSSTVIPPAKVTVRVVPVSELDSTPGNQSMLPASLTTFQTSSADLLIRACLRIVATRCLLVITVVRRPATARTVRNLSLRPYRFVPLVAVRSAHVQQQQSLSLSGDAPHAGAGRRHHVGSTTAAAGDRTSRRLCGSRLAVRGRDYRSSSGRYRSERHQPRD